ncbi:MAG TPA: ethanolamine ammonia-lyase subunit EutC [Chitinophagaceae bacterium]|nr:ethanolamine ammonia-lyase subunit EutC [Chitinophagaceae bacterium]
MSETLQHQNNKDPWVGLRKYTNARIALGRAGVSVPTSESLQFSMAHAFARDAVYDRLQVAACRLQIERLHPCLVLHSRVVDREQYLLRPDLGRRLNDESLEELRTLTGSYDVCINLADGLSATAVNNHAVPLLQLLIPRMKDAGWSLSPVCIIEQGRVAISDETGAVLNAKLSLILIGERPGLSSPDSLGAYLTYGPAIGNTDERRNCISNINANGLSYEAAADKIMYLVSEALRLKLSGVGLKDNSGLLGEGH